MNNAHPERQGRPAPIIQDVCQDQNAVLAAYIFGSRAKNTAKPKSDADVAVLLDEQSAMPFDYLEFKVSLERGLNADVDLVVLNTAGEAMKHQVRRDGKLVFDQNPRKRKAWEIRSRQLYQDFLHLHNIYMQYFYRSLTSSHG